MQANTSAENAAAVRHSVKNNMITSSSDGVKEPDNSPLGGDGGQNVTLGDLFSGVSKIDKTKMQAALLELLKKEMQTGKNASELFDEPCDMDEHQSNGNQVWTLEDLEAFFLIIVVLVQYLPVYENLQLFKKLFKNL